MVNEKTELTLVSVNAATGETIERPLTDNEIAENEKLTLQGETAEAERLAKIEARENALFKLAALGLTQEEIEAL
jgi:hypothetical protein